MYRATRQYLFMADTIFTCIRKGISRAQKADGQKADIKKPIKQKAEMQ
jgi:hypothetical protein